jgi:hypothetical protein
MHMRVQACAWMRTLAEVVERLHCLVAGELKAAVRAAAKQRGQSVTTFVTRALEAALSAPSASQRIDPAGGPPRAAVRDPARTGSVASSSLQNFMPKGPA